jgi:hypothetical protein
MFEGQRIDIDRYGNAEEYSIGFFDTIISAVGDLVAADNEAHAKSLYNEKLADIYPQPINPEWSYDEDDA